MQINDGHIAWAMKPGNVSCWEMTTIELFNMLDSFTEWSRDWDHTREERIRVEEARDTVRQEIRSRIGEPRVVFDDGSCA